MASAFSRHSTRPNPAEREWGCGSAGRSWKGMEAGCGQKGTNLAAPYFGSPCPAPKESSRPLFSRFTGRESRAETPPQMLFIHRLTKVADHAVVQGAAPVSIIGIGSHEDCRDHAARIDEASVKLDPGHGRHVDVGDQAGPFGETGGGKETGCRWKSLDRIAQRPHESSHGVAKEPIIFNDRNQLLCHHAAPGISPRTRRAGGLAMPSLGVG